MLPRSTVCLNGVYGKKWTFFIKLAAVKKTVLAVPGISIILFYLFRHLAFRKMFLADIMFFYRPFQNRSFAVLYTSQYNLHTHYNEII